MIIWPIKIIQPIMKRISRGITSLQAPPGILVPLIFLALLIMFVLLPVAQVEAQADDADEAETITLNHEHENENAGKVSMDFKDVDIRTVIEYMGRVTGKGFVVDESVRGKVSVISPRDMITQEEAMALLDALLAIKGYSTKEEGNVIHILPSPEMQKRMAGLVPEKRILVDMGDEAVVTALIPLTYMEAATVRGVLAPLLPKETSLQVFAPSNSLIITDRAESAKRILPLIEVLDMKKGVGVIEKIEIMHSTAEDVAEKINRVFKQKDIKEGTPFQHRSAEVMVYPDKRTNSLLVVASSLEISMVKELVILVDVPVDDEDAELHLYYLKYVDVTELEGQLKGIFAAKTQPVIVSTPKTETRREKKVIKTGPGKTKTVWVEKPVRVQSGKNVKTNEAPEVAISSSKSMNILVVVARPPQHEIVKELIDSLDVDSLPSRHIRIIPLTFADEETVIEQVSKLCGLGGDPFKGSSPMFMADSRLIPNVRLRAVMVSTASVALMEEIESVIKRLDRQKVKGQSDVHIYRLKNADATSIAETINKLYSMKKAEDKTAAKVEAVVEPSLNALLINAPPHMYDEIEVLLEQLDVLRPQVLVEALIAEVRADTAEKLGIEWGYVDSADGRLRGFGFTNYAMKSSALSSQGLSLGVIKGELDLNKVDGGSDDDINEYSKIRGIIQAHRNDSDFNIISTPSILTLDNEEAMITVGEVVALPQGYISGNQTSDLRLTNFTYEDIGVTLNITPRITQKEFVTLKIEQTIKNRQDSFLYDFNVPIITKREAKTTVTVPNQETVVIGGLITEVDREVVDKVPGLHRMPLLGDLFKKKRVEKQKVNLLIFITPHVIFNPAEMALKDSKQPRYGKARGTSSPAIMRSTVSNPAVAPIILPSSVAPTMLPPGVAPRKPVSPDVGPKSWISQDLAAPAPEEPGVEQTAPVAPEEAAAPADEAKERWKRILNSDQRVREAFDKLRQKEAVQ